jgi:hypothetical protein
LLFINPILTPNPHISALLSIFPGVPTSTRSSGRIAAAAAAAAAAKMAALTPQVNPTIRRTMLKKKNY